MIEITQAYRQQPEEVLTALQTSPNGLSRAEVERRLAQHGPNQIERHKRKTTLQILLDQARGFM
jgi:Ca2+-transporting ATPase